MVKHLILESDLLLIFHKFTKTANVEVFLQEIKALFGDWQTFTINGKTRSYRDYKAFPANIKRDANSINDKTVIKL
jgi:hypothetical protein